MAYKNNPKKDAMEKTKEHWEIDAGEYVFPRARKDNPLDSFIAKNPKEWPRTHVKINETDY